MRDRWRGVVVGFVAGSLMWFMFGGLSGLTFPFYCGGAVSLLLVVLVWRWNR